MIIQQPSLATLKPDRDESVNFDETENLFIEGDDQLKTNVMQTFKSRSQGYSEHQQIVFRIV